MIRKLTIEGYRCFEKFEMDHLTRVNLLVGKNNSGKTAVLEAVRLLETAEPAEDFCSILMERGEVFPNDPSKLPSKIALNTSSVFHELHQDFAGRGHGHVSIRSGNDSGVSQLLSITLSSEGEDDPQTEFVPFESAGGSGTHILIDRSPAFHQAKKPIRLPVSENFAFEFDSFRTRNQTTKPRVIFLGANSLDPKQTTALLESVYTNGDELKIIEALKIIEPAISDIVSVPSQIFYNSRRSGIVARKTGQRVRVPIGSMGDGMWRMLGIALSLVSAKGGTILIDEIDSGLHYTTLEKMWRLVLETAKRQDVNVQVFATTHSLDCVRALARLAQDANTDEEDQVSIHRIEAGNPSAVSYSEAEIAVAAEQGTEVR